MHSRKKDYGEETIADKYDEYRRYKINNDEEYANIEYKEVDSVDRTNINEMHNIHESIVENSTLKGTIDNENDGVVETVDSNLLDKEEDSKDNSTNDVVIAKKITLRSHTSLENGLTSEEVKERKDKGEANEGVEPPSQSIKEIILYNICTYFNLIFGIISALLIAVGSFRDLTFLPVIICNTCIGIVQQIYSKITLDKLSVVNAPHAQVLRDGKEQTINIEELVLDDIVVFKSGSQIPADAIVREGEVRVNESLITGEADEIVKRPGDLLLSGSFIISGTATTQLYQVGKNSYASKLTIEAKKTKEGEQSEMIKSLDIIVRGVGIAIIPISIILFLEQHYLAKINITDSVTSTLAAVIGMIPEGLYLLTSVALAVSARRLAKRQVLLHDMKCIETLARVNVLCVDKTGTITENEMKVSDIVPIQEGFYEVDNRDDNIIDVCVERDNVKEDNRNAMMLSMGDFVKAMPPDNETMIALSHYFKDSTDTPVTNVIPFSSTTKYSSVEIEEEVYVLGAPEFVLRDDFKKYEGFISKYSSKGERVLVYGTCDKVVAGEPISSTVKPIGLVLLSNPIRKSAPETFKYFQEQGVEVKVISGDSPKTVAKIAGDAGIKNADKYVDASTLLTQEDIVSAASNYTVFGRVTPEQKRKLVRAIKAEGNTVAMTGDGVNDVLALKDADCSIAMASGSEVASQAAQLVLLDSDFSRMPSVVLEGRRVVNNIERSASLFLVKNLFSFLMAMYSIIFLVNYPLQPSQVSLVSTFTIGIPAFLLALEKNTRRIEGKFIKNVLYKALPAALTDFIIVGSLVEFGKVFGVSTEDVSTAAVLLMAVVGFMILFRISRPMNAWRFGVFMSMIIGILFCRYAFSNLFRMSDISYKCTLLLIVFAIASESIFRYLTLWMTQLKKYKENIKRYFKTAMQFILEKLDL